MGTVLDKTSMAHGVVRPAAAAAMVSIALLLGACAQSGDLGLGLGLDSDKPKTSDIATASAGARPEADLEKATAYWGEQHGKNPRDPKAAIAYARNLKALGRKTQALAVMQASYMYSPDDKEFLSEYGRLSLDMGQISTAGELLARADDPGKPDWKILSARGTVLAKQGRLKEAIELYEKARSLAPEQASLMNNLAMAYTMDGQAARGEHVEGMETALVEIVPVDVEQAQPVIARLHDVGIPDFLEKRSSHGADLASFARPPQGLTDVDRSPVRDRARPALPPAGRAAPAATLRLGGCESRRRADRFLP